MNKKTINIFTSIILVLGLLLQIYLVIFFAPVEKIMGPIQKIFYFHVSVGWLGMAFFLFSAILSILYLLKSKLIYPKMASVAVLLGFIFSLANIISGSIWAKVVWNTWWTWDPRLVTVTIMMLMFLGYLLLNSTQGIKKKKNEILSIYLIIASLTVPLTFFSIKLFRTIHPLIINDLSMNLTSKMSTVMFYSIIYFTFLGAVLFIRILQKITK